MKMHGERNVFGVLCHRGGGGRVPRHVDRAWNTVPKGGANHVDSKSTSCKSAQDKVPRSSSPVSVYAELPSSIQQAFATIAWDDLEDCARKNESDSLGSQVNGSDADEQNFGEFALDFTADSPATLESSLSPAELVPFQGCVIPPLTPQHVFSPQNDDVLLPNSSCTHDQDGELWTGFSSCQARMGHAVEANLQVHETLQRRSEPSEEGSLHLRQLACRAKLLASVLEKLMADRKVDKSQAARPSGAKSSSPCKRQRLDDGCQSPDSVEEILRDVGTRCHAVLCAQAGAPRRDTDAIPVYGSFSGLQTSICKDSSSSSSSSEADTWSFRTTVKEHGTIRTRVFPHGRAFTSGTRHGGYRFRWVPDDN